MINLITTRLDAKHGTADRQIEGGTKLMFTSILLKKNNNLYLYQENDDYHARSQQPKLYSNYMFFKGKKI